MKSIEVLTGDVIPKVAGLQRVKVVYQAYSLMLIFYFDANHPMVETNHKDGELKRWADEQFPRRKVVHFWTQHLNDSNNLDGSVLTLQEDQDVIDARLQAAAKEKVKLDALIEQHGRKEGFRLYMLEANPSQRKKKQNK